MPVLARRFLRKMRGGAQAHLLEASDGYFYVVKFLNNPQHRRILINELFCWQLLKYLQIAVPPCCIVGLTEHFLQDNPEVYIQLGTQKVRVQPGWHFGSRYPGHPDRVAVYDFLPDKLLKQLANPTDFLGALCFDRWVSNADGRQAIFFRQRSKAVDINLPRNPTATFYALMIDYGYAFQGSYWELANYPVQGLYHRGVVYETVTGLDSFSPWLERILHLPTEVLDKAYASIPIEWFQEDQSDFEQLLERLYRRRKQLPNLLKETVRSKPEFFPNWKESLH